VTLALALGAGAGLAWLAVVLARRVWSQRRIRSLRTDPLGLRALAMIAGRRDRGPPAERSDPMSASRPRAL
jgi:hypothetical protein